MNPIHKILIAIIIAASATTSFADISQEASPLRIKGSRIFSFTSKSIEGLKDGYLPGLNREESLRINIAGSVEGTNIDANFFSTSLMSGTALSSREESISIKLINGSTEAYFGDFTPLIDDLEFGQINKSLSGLQVKSATENFDYKIIASSPKGQPRLIRMYGNNTQGPYNLGASPIVIDSENILVDNVLQKRGNDYDMDYEAGTITFKRKTINIISVIEATFDYRETLFQHSTYAIQGNTRINPNLKVGAAYIDDSDSLKDAQSISQSASQEPQSHRVIDVNGTFSLGPQLNLFGEAAMSEKNLNLLAPNYERGKALKLELFSDLGQFNLSSKYKLIGPKFSAVGDALPKQNLTEYQTQINYKPNDIILTQGSLSESKYTQNQINYKNSARMGRILITPPKLLSTEYIFSEYVDSNDPVTTSPIDRLTTKNSLELKQTFGLLNTSLKGSQERRLNRSPSYEATTYKTINAGISYTPEDRLSLTSNIELKDTTMPDNSTPITKTYITNISASPNKRYMITGSLNYIDDSLDGINQVTDVALKADPIDQIKTNSKYTISTLKETFGGTSEGVRHEEGSYLLEIRPFDRLKLRYNFKPNFTILNRTQKVTYFNQTGQGEINFFLFKETLLGYSDQAGNAYMVDKTDYPNYQRIQNSQNTGTRIYSIKTAPLRFLSCELNYILDNRTALSLQATNEPSSYNTQNDRNKEINATIKTSLSERLAIDTSYSRRTNNSGSGESEDDYINNLNNTGSIKLIYNFTDSITISPSYSYSEIKDYLLNDTTYTIQPGIGFTLKFQDRLRIDSTYTYAKSHSGTNTEDTIFTMRGKYDLSDYIHITLIGNTETSKNPNYKTSEFSGNVEINL